MKCQYCDAELRAEAKFCSRCGKQVEKPTQVADADITVVCRQCGTMYKKEFVVCPTCGNIYAEEQPKAENKPEAFTCPRCGKELPAGKAFCKYCGEKLNRSSENTDAVPTGAASATPTPTPTFLYHTDLHQPEKPHAQENPKPTPNVMPESPSLQTELGFMGLNEFLIDEKVSAFKFENSYKVYDLSGKLVGAVIQDGVSTGAAAARLLVGKGAKALQKFSLEIVSPDGTKLGKIYREGGSFASICVENAKGRLITSMKLRFGSLRDEMDNLICKFGVGFKTCPLKDENGNELAAVTIKWNGAKSLFTTADKYHVKISPTLKGDRRLVIAAITLAYDMLAGDR